MAIHIRNALGALLMAAGLVACGGGGGGSDPGPGGPGSGSPTGLVPAAPVPGATLYPDASALYVIRPGAEWHYRGTASTASAYGVLVTQSGAAGTASIRRLSNLPDDSQDSSVTVSGGQVRVQEMLAFDPSSPIEDIGYVLLRSPVRVDDQFTLFERVNLDTQADLDGDGRNDSVDLAAYSRVVGNETVSLPDLQRSVQALRVDTTLRLRLPAGGTLEVGIVQSDWYVPGVGPVRRRVVDQATGVVESEEWLVYWDGLNEGLGALPARKVTAAAGSDTALFGRPWSAVGLGDRVLVASTDETVPPTHLDRPLTLTVLDLRGDTVASVTHPGRDVERVGSMLGIAGNAALLTQAAAAVIGSEMTYDVRMERFDASGSRVGDAAGVGLVTGTVRRNVAAATDGQKLWLLWVEAEATSQTQRLMLRDFTADGVAVGQARQLATAPLDATWTFSHLALAAGTDRVLATWSQWSDVTFDRVQWFALAVGGAAPQVQPMGVRTMTVDEVMQPIVTTGSQALAWIGLLGFEAFSHLNDLLLRAVALADDSSLRLASPGTLDDEILTSGQDFPSGTMYRGLGFADGADFKATAVRAEKMLSVDAYAARFIEILRWPGDAVLAGAAPPSAERWRLERAGGISTPASFGELQLVVPLDDRLLFLGADHLGISRTVVFRH